MTTLEAAISDDPHEAVVAQTQREHIAVDQRAARGDWEKFDRIMARVPDVPPVPGDEK